MEATVRTFSEATSAGTVLLDDGTEMPFAAEAFDADRLRLLRVGQRVRITVENGRIVHLTLASLPPAS
jgi:cold shock CspA family protein